MISLKYLAQIGLNPGLIRNVSKADPSGSQSSLKPDQRPHIWTYPTPCFLIMSMRPEGVDSAPARRTPQHHLEMPFPSMLIFANCSRIWTSFYCTVTFRFMRTLMESVTGLNLNLTGVGLYRGKKFCKSNSIKYVTEDSSCDISFP